ncbi:hypothetical protein ABIE27_005518 [Paenibacillus sp. 4624]|jgi:hypothetical protein
MTTSEKCKLKNLIPDLKENRFVFYRLAIHLNDHASLDYR